MSLPVPNLIDLIKRRMTGEEDEVRQFFDISRKPNKTWLDSITPGVRIAQRVLNAHWGEQTTGNANEPSEQEERQKLCAELFGAGDLDTLRKLASSISSKIHVRLDFVKDGAKTVLKVSEPKPDDFKREEPPEGLIPAPAVPSSSLEAMLAELRPKVRLEGDANGTMEEVLSAVLQGSWSRKVVMLVPSNKPININVAFGLLAQIRKQPWLGFDYKADTVIQRARNILAMRFLESEAEWALWHDDDMVLPFKDPAFFYDPIRLNCDESFIPQKFVNVMAIERLMKAQKTIIGGVYQARRGDASAPLVIQPCLHPRNAEDRTLTQELRAHGPIDKVVQVGYVATGCAMVHRNVFRDIMQKFPERQPSNPEEPFDFFGESRGGEGGEDIFFCGLAAQAGHASYLDCGLWCAHLGTYAFFPPRSLK
jgi:hypothetical protein